MPVHALSSLRARFSHAFLLVGLILLSFAPARATAGPVSPYYLTAGDQSNLHALQGSGILWSAPAAHSHQSPIAVDASIKTMTSIPSEGVGIGNEYTLTGNVVGSDFATSNIRDFYDGASDGEHYYSVDYLTGGVYRFDTNWQNPTLLFTASVEEGWLGITFDPSNNSLWLSAYDANSVSNFAMDGALLSTFYHGHAYSAALALDPADGTLWMSATRANGLFEQFSKTGVRLSQIYHSALSTENILGGEFSSVPEPSAYALAACGILGLAIFRRRPSR